MNVDFKMKGKKQTECVKRLMKNDPDVEASGQSKIDKLAFPLILALNPSHIGEAGPCWVPIVPHQRED